MKVQPSQASQASQPRTYAAFERPPSFQESFQETCARNGLSPLDPRAREAWNRALDEVYAEWKGRPDKVDAPRPAPGERW